eukprot:TRINITY_DN7502_c0_g2_i1.p1 TRINITY_DN7502_c0_g2~~TRINITY_DN7502_c0_g2_i1.p1  ORF type:complete len:743 (-),score=213.42 TRINITY_DN7502_c0_g2_i1:173-2401(-)
MTPRSPLSCLVALVAFAACAHAASFLSGSGIADVTGPAAQANLMGMANVEQIAHGIQLRLYSRAFVFQDPNTSVRVAWASVDVAFIPGGLAVAVTQKLAAYFGSSRYNVQNVMLSATHTHSGPGGYSTETLYDVTSFGFIQKNFDTIVDGIAQSIIDADANVQPSNIFIANSTLLNSNANRSPYSYPFNPEANNYPYNVDKNITVLRIEKGDGTPTGMISWFAVHGTSMNNTNTLISGDNKGFASWYVERTFNGDKLPGQGSFVAAFGQCNEGDVSPNTQGAMCPDGSPCDARSSTCNGRVQECIAPGPGKDMTESCAIIGMNQAQKSLDLFKSAGKQLSGPVMFRHQYVDFENVSVSSEFSSTGKAASTCTAALGDSFAAGTTDGPGFANFVQGTNSTLTNPVWNTVGHILSKPTRAQKSCQSPKPILLNTGGITIPEHSPWSASVIPLQLFRVGNLYLIGVPAEFTTMSGRRLIAQVKKTLEQNGAADANTHYIISGLSNEYTHYCATPEEYNVQRYEAASTLYGPQELPAYLQIFTTIATSMAQNTSLPPGPNPPTGNFSLRLFPEWPKDTTPNGISFGQVLQDVQSSYTGDQIAQVQFQGANPRNNYRIGSTFLTVEFQNSTGGWQVMLTDADWETIFHWERGADEHDSIITLKWLLSDDVPHGTYRMRYFGDAKAEDGTISPISGTSSSFTVQPSSAAFSLQHALGTAPLNGRHAPPLRARTLSSLTQWWRDLRIRI